MGVHLYSNTNLTDTINDLNISTAPSPAFQCNKIVEEFSFSAHSLPWFEY